MLAIIGLGLDWKDWSVKAEETIKKARTIYLEAYTSVPNYSVKKLENYFGKKIIVLNRKQVEEGKLEKNSVLLAYGDPLSATTHIGFKAKVIHAPSVLTAVAETGLQLYKFGKTASIPFWEKNHKPESFFDILEQNQKIGAHTLFLLDLRPEENKFLTIKEAIDMLLKIGKQRHGLVNSNTLVIGCARLGMNSKIVAGKASKVAKASFGKPPYCLIIPASLHFVEKEFLNRFL